ncbi:MAG TPA: hypothetical protein VFH04_04395 [Nitrososphaeraceae archaeon]|nr:hypothetical protein [Nitrososphaeraceae archaeon]
MNNKRMLDLRLGNIFIILGTAFGLLVSVSSQMLSASIPGDASGPNASNPNQEAANHINEAKSALQNGDTEGAQRHLDLAHQALG